MQTTCQATTAPEASHSALPLARVSVNQLGDGLGHMIPPQVSSVARKPLSIAFEEIAQDKIVWTEAPEIADEPEVDADVEVDAETEELAEAADD